MEDVSLTPATLLAIGVPCCCFLTVVVTVIIVVVVVRRSRSSTREQGLGPLNER